MHDDDFDAVAPGRVVTGGATSLESLDLVVDHDPEAVVGELLGQVRGLEMSLHGGQIAQALGAALLERVRSACSAIGELAAAPFRVVVIGEFKRGKSTLVNALLGDDVAPVDPLPETMTINAFSRGEGFSAELRLVGGGRIALRREHLTRAGLLPVVQAAQAEVRGIDIRLPSPLLEDVVLVDTPGTGDIGSDVRRVVRTEIAAADLLIVVISALAPLSATERDLLCSCVKPHNFPKILFVLNRVDLLETTDDLNQIRDAVAGELSNQFPGMRLYAVSALEETRRRLGNARKEHDDLDLARAFDALRDEVIQLVRAQRRAIRADRVAAACVEYLGDLEARLQMLAHALDKRGADADTAFAEQALAPQRLIEENDARRARLEKEIKGLAREAENWMREFGERFSREVLPQLAGMSRTDIERDMQFFMGGRVEAAIGACLASHENALAAIAGDLLGARESAVNVSLHEPSRLAASVSYSGAQWSAFNVVHLAIEQVFGLGVVVDVLSGLLATTARGLDSKSYVDSFARSGPKFAEAFASAARSAYDALLEELRSRLEEAHTEGRQASDEAARQAAVLHRERASELQGARRAVDEALVRVDETRKSTTLLRARVSGPAQP